MKSIYLIIAFMMLFSTLNSQGDSNMFLFNEEKSNFLKGTGNISYPVITHMTEENIFKNSNNICIADINGDGDKEIVAVSVPEGALKVYDKNLTLLWSFYDKYYQKWHPYLSYSGIEEGISSLALVDIDGDGIKDIIFSISPCAGPKNTKSGGVYIPKTTLYAFKGDGSVLWNITFNGSITPNSLVVSDINGDGINEIIVGTDNLYVLNLHGKPILEYSLTESGIRNIYSIISNKNEIVFTFWHHSDYNQEPIYILGRDIYNTYFTMEKIYFENGTFNIVWKNILEKPNGALGPNFYTMFSNSNFSSIYLVQARPSGLLKINEDSGRVEWKKKSDYVVPPETVVCILPKVAIWNEIKKIRVIDSSGKIINSFFIYENIYKNSALATISVFDINNDNKNDIVLIDKEGLLVFSINGKKIMSSKLWPKAKGYWDPAPPILHSDTDNDGFDEIITIDPDGRIVIIDNGAPPKENEGISMEMLIFGGAGAVIAASALIWIWRKKRNEK